MNSNLDKVKIVVVGDSGVGKTSLIHLIAHQEILKKPSWTIGCSVDVKLHEFKDGTIKHKTYFIEFFDIGGNLGHKQSAKMFLTGVDGVILVHDLTNRKSQDNLKHWLYDIIEQNENLIIGSNDYSKTGIKCNIELDSSSLPPLLFVGTKLDQAQMVRNTSSLRTSSPISINFRSDEINLDCMQPKYLAPGTSNSIKLAKFFDKVIETRQMMLNKQIFKDKSNIHSTIQSEKQSSSKNFYNKLK